MENKTTNIGKFLKASLGIFLASAIVAIVGFALTSNAEKADFVLAELTKTLEIKAGELKEAKELEEQLKVSYEQASKARELKQEEKKNAMSAIDDYVNSGLSVAEKSSATQSPVFQKAEK